MNFRFTFRRNFLSFAIIFFNLSVFAQTMERADFFYNRKEYGSASIIYEKLVTPKNAAVVKSKLANCYRIVNRMQQAEPLYAEVTELEKPNPADYLRYGEVLMSLSKYEQAKIWFKKSLKEFPENTLTKNLLANCDKVKTIPPYFRVDKLTPFSKNETCDDNAAVFYNGGIVFASDRSAGWRPLKEKNPETNRDYPTLFYAERTSDTSFAEPKEFSGKITATNKVTANASFTADGKHIYFCRNSMNLSKSKTYTMQLYTAETTDGEHWSNIESLSFCDLNINYFYPAVSPDGKFLFFSSDKSGESNGGLDIYMSRKSKKGWSKPENLGPKINTSAHEICPFYTKSGKLYFCSKGHLGYGGYDIFVTERDTDNNWKTPINVGLPINSAYDDISIAFSPDGQLGTFTSSRSGAGDDIFLFKLKPGIADTMECISPNDTAVTHLNSEAFTINSIPRVQNENSNRNNSSSSSKTSVTENNTAEDIVTKSVETPTAPDFITVQSLGIFKEWQTAIDKGKEKNKSSLTKSALFNGFKNAQNIIEFSPAQLQVLDALADFLQKNKQLTFSVAVHSMTQTKENAAEIKYITQTQAEAITAYLVSKGVRDKRLTARGLGKNQPLTDCSSAPCAPNVDAENARVVFKIHYEE